MKILKLALLFVIGNTFAQNVKYVDEKMQIIDSLTLTKKCQQHLYKCLKYDTDTLIVNKVLYKYNFGHINKSTYQEIKNILISNSKTKIDSNATIIIQYYDSLRSFNTVNKIHMNHVKKEKVFFIDSAKRKHYYPKHKFNKKIFEKNREKFVKTSNKCIKKYENKFNTRVFYVFDDDSNVSKDYENFNWIADNGIFNDTFFNILFNYTVAILKPDGEYFLIGSHFSDKNIYKLLENNDWTKFKEEWKQSHDKYKINGIGLFKKESDLEHKKHCF